MVLITTLNSNNINELLTVHEFPTPITGSSLDPVFTDFIAMDNVESLGHTTILDTVSTVTERYKPITRTTLAETAKCSRLSETQTGNKF